MKTTPVRRLLRAIPALLLVLFPCASPGSPRSRQQPPATNWADDVLKQESYAQPPKELVDAVLAPATSTSRWPTSARTRSGSSTRSATVPS